MSRKREWIILEAFVTNTRGHDLGQAVKRARKRWADRTVASGLGLGVAQTIEAKAHKRNVRAGATTVQVTVVVVRRPPLPEIEL